MKLKEAALAVLKDDKAAKSIAIATAWNIKNKLYEDANNTELNPKAKEAIKRKTKIIINPPLIERKDGFDPTRNKDLPDNDPSRAVSDPYKVLGEPNVSIELKDLAFKIIKARSGDDLS